MNPRLRRLVPCLFATALLTTWAAPGVADARITKVAIDTVLSQSPTFGGYSWPGVGQYEKVVGTAFGEVNPLDPQNAVIVDIQLAPRNSRKNVEYSFDFYILKPKDLSKDAHKVMYEPPNRGRKTWQSLGRVTSGGFGPSVGAPIAMGYAPAKTAAAGTLVGLVVRGKILVASIADLPFQPHAYYR